MDRTAELSQLQAALADCRAQLAELQNGPGLKSARAALCAGTEPSAAQSSTLSYWNQLVQQEKDLAERLRATAETARPSPLRSSDNASSLSAGSKRRDLIAEAVARPDPAGLHWHWLRPNAVGHHKAGSVDTAARDQHQRAVKQLRLHQEVNAELSKACCDSATRQRLRESNTPETTALANVLDRCQELAQEGIFFAHLTCTTAELGFTDDWPTANKFWEKAAQLDASVGLDKLLEDARAAALKDRERKTSRPAPLRDTRDLRRDRDRSPPPHRGRDRTPPRDERERRDVHRPRREERLDDRHHRR